MKRKASAVALLGLIALLALLAAGLIVAARRGTEADVDHMQVAATALAEFRMEDAERHFKRQLELHPTDGVAADHLRWIYFNQFRVREVEAVLEDRLRQLPDDLGPAIELLNSEFRPQVPREVLQYWRTVRTKGPEQANVLATLGYCHWQTGDIDRAKEEIQRALELRWDDLRLRALAAEFAFELGDYDSAKLLTDEFEAPPDSAMDPAEARPYEDRCWWIRSRVLQREDKLEAAIRCNSRALSLRPAELPYVQHHGALLLQAGRSDEAADQLERASLLEAVLGELAEIVLAGNIESPNAELYAKIALLCVQRGRSLQGNAWRRAGDHFAAPK